MDVNAKYAIQQTSTRPLKQLYDTSKLAASSQRLAINDEVQWLPIPDVTQQC
ncbi:hypothetical protein VNI00_016294 [Paramarasmius palmivorus]|uniref:Uncharacterized protein n=1 Tax=Paramarasmius palmivorus TaxID=297713 RepID=A0AAW0BDS6_9AGAR